MPTIFVGSLRFVTFHLECMLFFIFFINLSDDMNSSKLSTQTVIISKLLPFHQIYAQGSDHKCSKPCFLSFSFNSLFHSHPDCFKPYNVFTNSA
jgi:hypothetical protein